nr:hypothetical protein [Campylobacter rectus]
MALAPDTTDVAISIYSAIYNVGIGGGALLGHQIATKFGLWHIGEAGTILGALGACKLPLRKREIRGEK